MQGCTRIGFSNYTAFGGFFPKGFWGMWVAVLVSLFSYFSIEMIAVAAGEAEDPQRAITQAFRATMLRLVLFYLLTLALILAIVPWTASPGRRAEPVRHRDGSAPTSRSGRAWSTSSSSSLRFRP